MLLSPRVVLSFAAALALSVAPRAHASTTNGLRDHIARLQSLTAACSASASSCNPAEVGADDTVGDPRYPSGFTSNWTWLRAALTSAAEAKPAERVLAMNQAQTRLNSLLADLNAPEQPDDQFGPARIAVHQTLSAEEFRTTEGAISPWERFKARLWSWISRAFEGLDLAAGHRPWIGRTIAALFFLAAGVGLLLFLRHQLAESRLRVKLNEAGARASGWARESTAWSELATERAAEGDFREAVHCLYWAAIVLLEGRRAWRHDPSRTPREYTRLLPAGSPQREHLRALTATFERLWYGLREASEVDYAAAREHFLALEHTRSTADPVSNTAAEPA
jgi:hypothetical protein